MKNLFLSLVFLFTVSFMYSANSVLENGKVEFNNIENTETNVFGLCVYSITTTITWSDGSSSSWTNTYQTSAGSLAECQAIAQSHVDSLNKL